MRNSYLGRVHVLEFECQAPLKFYEHCSACPKSIDMCPDLELGKDIIRGKKKIIYNNSFDSEGSVHAKAFNCLVPLRYFEKTRRVCAHKGRCREEGLLIALLDGKRKLVYTQKEALPFPTIKPSHEKVEIGEEVVQEMS